MVLEKTARKREVAVVNGIKPEIEKIGRGLEYLETVIQLHNEAERRYQERLDNAREIEREINNHTLIGQEKLAEEAYRRNIEADNRYQQERARLNDVLRNMMIRCRRCGSLISPVQLICHKCGQMSEVFPYEDGDLEMLKEKTTPDMHILQSRLMHFAPITAAYPEAQKKIEAMQRTSLIAKTYQQLSKTDTRKAIFARIQAEADGFIERTQNAHIEVAIVGDVKAGKSTLINALLGERMASTDATPETSTLVKYRTTKNKHYVKVTFYKTTQWKSLWDSTSKSPSFRENYQKSGADDVRAKYVDQPHHYTEFASAEELRRDIMRWTSKHSPEHYFVSELEVGYRGDLFPNDVILVDTPGLDDPVKYRSSITQEYIRNADWVVACVPGDHSAMSGASTLEFLSKISANLQHNTHKMIVIATKADTIRQRDREELQEQFLTQLHELTGRNKGELNDIFIYSAPLIHLLQREWCNGTLDEESDDFDELLAPSPRKFGFRKDINKLNAEEKERFKKSLGVMLLKEKLEDKIFSCRRKQLITQINTDYEQTSELIHSLAGQSLKIEIKNLANLQQESDDYHRQKAELQQRIHTMSENQCQLQTLLITIDK